MKTIAAELVLSRTFARLWAQRCDSDQLVPVLLAVYQVVAAVFAATKESDVLHVRVTGRDK